MPAPAVAVVLRARGARARVQTRLLSVAAVLYGAAPQAAAAQEEKLRQRLAAAAELALEKKRQADDKRKQAAKERMKALAARHALVSPMHPFAHRRTLCGG